MSMKRLALIAAVGSHHHHITHAPTTSEPSNLSPTLPSAATGLARGTTDEDNLKLNAAGLDDSDSPATEGGGSAVVGVSEFAGIREASESSDGHARHAESGGSSSVYYFSEHAGGGGGLFQGHQAMRPGATLNGNVNVLLGGAMLSVVITVVCVVCFCCHRSIKKRSDSFRRQQQWTDSNGANMEVYSVEQCYEASRLYDESPPTTSSSFHMSSSNHSGPPPSYDSVLAMDEVIGGRPSPPPKYEQPARQSLQKCCTIARQAPLSLHTSNGYQCRRQYQQQQPSLHSRTPCSCLRSQMNHLNTLRSQSTRTNHHDSNLNKTVPSPIDAFNNNVSNEDSQAMENSKPHYSCPPCQLCGKTQQCPEAIPTPPADSDVENGNAAWREPCSCCTLETFSLHYKTIDRFVELQDSSVAADTMVNEIPGSAPETQSATLESNSNSNQGDLHRQRFPEHHQQQHNRHSQQSLHLAHPLSSLDTFNENGIIRMDMSQIIDRTGLPTYEAAIKLESSGYV